MNMNEQTTKQQSQNVIDVLFRHEKSKMNVFLSIAFIAIILLFISSRPLSVSTYLITAGISLLVSGWQYYKCFFLKRANVHNLNLTLQVKQYQKFKTLIKYEIVILFTSLVIFFSFLFFSIFFNRWEINNIDFSLNFALSILGVFFLFFLLVLYYLLGYRLMFKKIECTLTG